MSEPINTVGASYGQLRTLAVRVSEDLRAQLDVVGQITGRSTTEEIRLALEHWIEKTKGRSRYQGEGREDPPGHRTGGADAPQRHLRDIRHGGCIVRH